MATVKFHIGRRGSTASRAASLDGRKRSAAGEAVVPEKVLTFESLEAFLQVLSPVRYRLLRHLRQHPEPSVLALSNALGRGYRRVHDDVVTLEDAGLLERDVNGVRVTIDKLLVEADLAK